LDEEIDTKECISSFGLRLRRFSKEKVSGVKEKDLSTLFFYLRDKCRFLGDTTKRAPESPAGLDLTHDIIGVDDAELDSGCGFDEGSIGQVCKESCNQKKLQSFEFQLNPTLFQSNKTIFGNQVEIKRDKLFFGSRKTLLPSWDRDFQPVLFRCKGTSIFFIVLAEWVIGPIEIDQNLPSSYRFNIEIAPLRIGLGF
jgi:hypothetical protein